ncbi:LysR family transcriptional regulator [Agrobacterium sp. MOPV5]|nr:LysR family transcriptional regulator [Agrobacterium leguminum]MBG0512131.1 LysR family transcriptional regulator [Agrobacterium leguminum]
MSSFVRVAETGSFSEAARDLERSQSAISQQVRLLEQHLGVRLIDRTTRRFSLTDAGIHYLNNAKLALEVLNEADASVADLENSMSGRLSITAPVNFGTNILGGFVFNFLRSYPNVKLDVSLSARFVDIVGAGFDLAIRMGETSEPNLIVRSMGTLKRSLPLRHPICNLPEDH